MRLAFGSLSLPIDLASPSTESPLFPMSDRIPFAPYHALRDQIEGLLSEGRLHTRQSSEWEKVVTYWHIGDALTSHIDGQPRADYGQRVVPDLSEDIGLSQALLWDILRFRRCLTTLPTHTELTWSHFKVISPLPTQNARRFYLQAARAFVQDALSQGTFVVLSTYKADAYGRYLADLRYLPGETDPVAVRDRGVYLNRQLLDEHLATRYLG